MFAGPSPDDEDGPYDASTSVRTVDTRDVSEELRKLGLEWRQADYFSGRQVVITLDPITEVDTTDIKRKVREAVAVLEETGLL